MFKGLDNGHFTILVLGSFTKQFVDDSDIQPSQRMSLFNVHAGNKEGICIYFRGRELRIKIIGSNNSTMTTGEGNKLLDPQTWYTIGIVAVRPRFMGKSSITVYINGEVLFQSNYLLFTPEAVLHAVFLAKI